MANKPAENSLLTSCPWDMLQMSRATFYRLLAKGEAPKPLVLPTRKAMWRVKDVEQWLAELPTRTPDPDRNPRRRAEQTALAS